MAKIVTDRLEAAQYNGREVNFVRDVTAVDGPSYNPLVSQTIVGIDGNEVYFFSNEVKLTDDEKKGADKANAKAKKEADQAESDRSERYGELKEHLAKTARGYEDKDAKPNDGKPHPRDENADRFNRTPGTPPLEPQTDGPSMNPNPAPQPTVTQPGLHPREAPIQQGAQPVGETQYGRPVVDQPSEKK